MSTSATTGTNGTNGTVTTRDGCELAFREAGPPDAARTLVMLHGWSQSQAMFDRLVPELPDDLRVLTYDARNHGVSGRTDRGPRIASLVADLGEVLDQRGIEHAHLLGHSMGSSILWGYVDLFGTARVDSLTLVDQPSVVAVLPWVSPEQGPEVGAIVEFAGVEGFVRGVMEGDHAAFRRAFLTSMLTPDIAADDLEWLFEQNMLLPMPWGAQLLSDHALQDWRDVLPHVDVPTLVVGGEVSHVAPSSQEWIAAQVPGAELKVFSREEGGAHFAFYESPKHFAAVLVDFLDRAGA